MCITCDSAEPRRYRDELTICETQPMEVDETGVQTMIFPDDETVYLVGKTVTLCLDVVNIQNDVIHVPRRKIVIVDEWIGPFLDVPDHLLEVHHIKSARDYMAARDFLEHAHPKFTPNDIVTVLSYRIVSNLSTVTE